MIAMASSPAWRKPPCRTSSTLITAGLYCSRNGIQNKSFTLSTTTPTVEVCPGVKDKLDGSKRSCAAVAGCAAFGGACPLPTGGWRLGIRGLGRDCWRRLWRSHVALAADLNIGLG